MGKRMPVRGQAAKWCVCGEWFASERDEREHAGKCPGPRERISHEDSERRHRWVAATPLVRWPHCGDCGVIKRKDGRNSVVCKGPPAVGPRSPTPQGAPQK